MSYSAKSFVALILCALMAFGISCNRIDRYSEISKIAIYFTEWGKLMYAGLTCEHLKELTTNPVFISDPEKIRGFISVVRKSDLREQPEYKDLDVRICCILEDDAGNSLIEISFSQTSLMQINGKVYLTDKDLFQLVISYLPPGYLMT